MDLSFYRKINNIQPLNNNYREQYICNTKNVINSKFSQSPYYQTIKIEGEMVDARVIPDKDYKSNKPYEEKKILFKPDFITDRGNYVELNNQQTQQEEIWLIMFFETNIMYPKAYIRKCNKVIECNKEKYPCVITSNIALTTNVEENKSLVLPNNYLNCYIKATTDTMQIIENDRFIIDNFVYEVQNIDNISNVDDNIGIIQMNLKKVPTNNKEEQIINKNNDEVAKEKNDITVDIESNTQEIKNVLEERW